MQLMRIFDLAGSGMVAESVRLNTVASNLANADSVAASPAEAYRARLPVFRAVLDRARGVARVRVAGIVEDPRPVEREYRPGHPLADADGYVWRSNVSVVEQMAEMIAASRAYQTNVEVLNTGRQLLLATLRLGQ
ncbi:MAG TPA: flagellar basal body rod protein FlgC [Chromatiales bacterium]|nr:flagellar basal body rod protein FlgC [Chromatiales bacterium]